MKFAAIFSAAIIAVGVALVANPAAAVIVGGNITGGTYGNSNFVLLTVPFTSSNPDNTVGNDNFNSHDLYGFNEDQNILLTDPLLVDVGGGVTHTIAAGTMVASHYIFWDPPGNGSTPLKTVTGNVEFNSQILGIATGRSLLDASDFLANTGVTYKNPGLRGL